MPIAPIVGPRQKIVSPYAPPVQDEPSPAAAPDTFVPNRAEAPPQDTDRVFTRVILPVVGLGMATVMSGLFSSMATQLAPVRSYHSQSINSQAQQSGNRWTIVRLTYYSGDLNQNMWEGVDSKGPAHVVSGSLTEDGRVDAQFQLENGKQIKREGNTDVASFIRDAARQYPPDHVMVIVDGHSHNLRHLVPKLSHALEDSGVHVDVLDLDSCSMGQADVAWQFRNGADYLLESQAYGMLNPRLDRINTWIAENPQKAENPRDVASAAAATKDHQRTSAVLDLKRIEPLRAPLQKLSEKIQQLDATGVQEFQNAAGSSQQFARNFPWDSSPAVDIRDLSRNLARSEYFKTHNPQLIEAAQAVAEKTAAAVTDQYHRNGYGVYGMQALYEHVSNPGGLSLMVPLDSAFPGHSTLHDFLYNPDLSFWSDTGWDKAMAHLAKSS